MNIYVDFDDCLCETARYFSSLVKDMFSLDVPYEEIKYFNLQKSFSLSDEDYAVEDSPHAFKFFEHLQNLKVLVFGRPWNQDCQFPNQNYKRCSDWNVIREIVR